VADNMVNGFGSMAQPSIWTRRLPAAAARERGLFYRKKVRWIWEKFGLIELSITKVRSIGESSSPSKFLFENVVLSYSIGN